MAKLGLLFSFMQASWERLLAQERLLVGEGLSWTQSSSGQDWQQSSGEC